MPLCPSCCSYAILCEQLSLYRNMTPKDLILRLVFNRPAVFWQEDDNWCLKDGTRGFGGFERIGTNAERKPAP